MNCDFRRRPLRQVRSLTSIATNSMTTPAQKQKRFRKRGGAKKKKKSQDAALPPSPPIPSSLTTPPPPPRSESYFSGFQEASSFLDPELQSYITKLSAELISLDPDESVASKFAKSPTDDPPPSVLLARNALAQLNPHMYELAQDPNASRLLEALIRVVADPDCVVHTVKAVVNLGAPRVATLITHPTGSFVLEKLLAIVANDLSEQVEDAVFALAECVTNWSREEIVNIMRSSPGSHVFRRIVALLAGLPVDEPREAKLDDSNEGGIVRYMYDMATDVYEEWKEAVVKIARRLIEDGDSDVSDFAWHTAPCTAVQALLSAVVISDRECARSLAEKCLKGQVRNLVRHSSGGRLVERAVLCFGAEIVKDVYEGHLKDLVKDPRANFCAQRILLGLKGRGIVMSAWDELEEVVPELMKFGKAREGVVLSLLRVTEVEGDNVCMKRASRCIAHACGAVGENSKNLTPILMLGSEELCKKWKDELENIGREGLGLHGGAESVLRVPGQNRGVPALNLLRTLMARCIMRYKGGPGQSGRDSFSAMGDIHLLGLVGSRLGSRLVEQWIDTEEGGATRRNVSRILNIATKESGASGILSIARNPYGAQILLKCTALASARQRKMVMDVLASDVENLKRMDCGQMLLRKLRVEQYMRREDEWENQESTRETRERLFAKILEDNEGEGLGEQKRSSGDNTKKRRQEPKRDVGAKRRKTHDAGEGHEKKEGVTDDSRENDIFEMLVNGKTKEMKRESKGNLPTEQGKDIENREGLDSVLGAIEKAAGPAMKEKKKKKKKR